MCSRVSPRAGGQSFTPGVRVLRRSSVTCSRRVCSRGCGDQVPRAQRQRRGPQPRTDSRRGRGRGRASPRPRPPAPAPAPAQRGPLTVWKLDEDGVLAQVLQDLLAQLDVQHVRLEHGVQVVANVLNALALEVGRPPALVRPAAPRNMGRASGQGRGQAARSVTTGPHADRRQRAPQAPAGTRAPRPAPRAPTCRTWRARGDRGAGSGANLPVTSRTGRELFFLIDRDRDRDRDPGVLRS